MIYENAIPEKAAAKGEEGNRKENRKENSKIKLL